MLARLFPTLGEHATILSPMFADYGTLTKIGDDVFVNHNAYFMDGGGITIGDHCFNGPDCGFYTADHARLPEGRNRGDREGESNHDRGQRVVGREGVCTSWCHDRCRRDCGCRFGSDSECSSGEL